MLAGSFGQENCDRVILVSSPTHLPRCLRDACSLWLDSCHHNSLPRDATHRTIGEHVEKTDAMEHGDDEEAGEGQEEADKHKEEEEGGGDKGRRRRHRLPSWRPVILASPSGTSYADYGPGDVAIVEPPHRGDSDRVWGDDAKSANVSSDGPSLASIIPALSDDARRASTLVAASGDSEAGKSQDVEADYALLLAVERGFKEPGESTTAPLLLHELVALALRVGMSSEERFRTEFQALLRRYTDKG